MTVSLEYNVDYPVGCPILSSTLGDALGAVEIDRGELDLLGFTVFSDTVIIAGGAIRRTIVLDESAQTDSNFPTDADLITACNNLYTAAFSLGVPGLVAAEPPVVA